jgi:hypothetical protein
MVIDLPVGIGIDSVMGIGMGIGIGCIPICVPSSVNNAGVFARTISASSRRVRV